MKNAIIGLTVVLIGLIFYDTLSSSPLIPRNRIFGNSTVLADSTNYVTLNKGLYARDSIKAGGYIIGLRGLLLDTLSKGSLSYDGYTVILNSDKAGGNMTMQLMGNNTLGSAGDFTWLFGNILSGTTGMSLDSATGLNVNLGNISLTGGTQQIKVPSDTVSDYDANDAVTINRQSGIITTKSLTTVVGASYSLTVTNSLCLTTSKVFAIVSVYGGLGVPNVTKCTPALDNGSFIVVITNLLTLSLNATVTVSYFLVNN